MKNSLSRKPQIGFSCRSSMAAKRTTKRPPQFTGRTAWTGAGPDNTEGRITHALDRGAEFALDVVDVTGPRYTVLLRRSGSTLTGKANEVGGDQRTATCTVDEFTGESGRVLVGTWLEAGTKYQWWVLLDEEEPDDV